MSCFVEEAESSCSDLPGNKKTIEYLSEVQPAVSVLMSKGRAPGHHGDDG